MAEFLHRFGGNRPLVKSDLMGQLGLVSLVSKVKICSPVVKAILVLLLTLLNELLLRVILFQEL